MALSGALSLSPGLWVLVCPTHGGVPEASEKPGGLSALEAPENRANAEPGRHLCKRHADPPPFSGL